MINEIIDSERWNHGMIWSKKEYEIFSKEIIDQSITSKNALGELRKLNKVKNKIVLYIFYL